MRMTLEAFHTWSQHLELSPETEALISTIRSSRPVRRVSGRAGNITGRYPSPKMGVSIQFESERVEFWAIYGMERIAKPASVTLPMPQVAPKPSKPRVGQRAPERDPVGETGGSSARKASGCSFTEEIPVTLAQMREAGVSRFECPTYLAVRDIKPKGGHVKFPSHPKRTTNTPNQGLRWVKREITWRLSD